MASEQGKRCPICETELAKNQTVCPKCGTDASLFDSDETTEDIEAIRESKSLDDLMASVLGGDEKKAARKAKADTLDDLDLDLPDEPLDQPKLELEVLEKDVLGKDEEGEETVTFECPGCGAEVEESTTRCPSCGALFAEEGVFDCPVCGSSVSVEAAQCARCGVRFVDQTSASADRGRGSLRLREADISHGGGGSGGASRLRTTSLKRGGSGSLVKAIMARYDDQRRREEATITDPRHLQTTLHREVSSLKGLVTLAKRLRVPVDNTQRVIAEAVKKARSRDLVNAVKLAWGARISMEQSLALQVAQRLEIQQEDLKVHGEKKRTYPVAEALVEEAIGQLAEGRISEAYDKLQLSKEDMASKSSGQSEARYALRAAEELIDDVAQLGVGLAGVKEVLAQGKAVLRKGNWENATQLAAIAQQKAREAVREGIAEEMKRARQRIMELKMQGRDVGELIDMLKQASASVKEGGYAEALEYLQMFKKRA